MPDVPARWSSPAWREEARTWLEEALGERGITTTGPMVQDHVRFWPTVLHVDTDAGRVWLTENAPSQSFEAVLDLPLGDPRRLTDDEVRSLDTGTHHIAHAAATLSANGLPSSLKHNDLHTGNAFRTEEGLEEVVHLAPAAERIASLHRAESWRRLQADVPVAAVDEDYRGAVPAWLVDAAAPDPLLSATAC